MPTARARGREEALRAPLRSSTELPLRSNGVEYFLPLSASGTEKLVELAEAPLQLLELQHQLA